MRKTYYTEEEEKLVNDCLSGQQQAQYDLYQKYVQAMYNVVVRMVKHTEDAEDVIQEVFVKVFRSLHTFNGESTLGAWIKRITVNTTLNFIRKDNKNSTTSIADHIDIPDTEEIVDASKYSMAQIHHAIKQLPERCSAIISLFLIEGYQHKEIATILNITESTSKTQYRRGKFLLQDILNELPEFE